jgi:hypothetical protein
MLHAPQFSPSAVYKPNHCLFVRVLTHVVDTGNNQTCLLQQNGIEQYFLDALINTNRKEEVTEEDPMIYGSFSSEYGSCLWNNL